MEVVALPPTSPLPLADSDRPVDQQTRVKQRTRHAAASRPCALDTVPPAAISSHTRGATPRRRLLSHTRRR